MFRSSLRRFAMDSIPESRVLAVDSGLNVDCSSNLSILLFLLSLEYVNGYQNTRIANPKLAVVYHLQIVMSVKAVDLWSKIYPWCYHVIYLLLVKYFFFPEKNFFFTKYAFKTTTLRRDFCAFYGLHNFYL